MMSSITHECAPRQEDVWWSGGVAPPFLVGGERSASRSGLMGPRADLGFVEKRKNVALPGPSSP
jgi:hypothetical protein